LKLAKRTVAAAISPEGPNRQAKALNFKQSFVNYFLRICAKYTKVLNGSQRKLELRLFIPCYAALTCYHASLVIGTNILHQNNDLPIKSQFSVFLPFLSEKFNANKEK